MIKATDRLNLLASNCRLREESASKVVTSASLIWRRQKSWPLPCSLAFNPVIGPSTDAMIVERQDEYKRTKTNRFTSAQADLSALISQVDVQIECTASVCPPTSGFFGLKNVENIGGRREVKLNANPHLLPTWPPST